MKFFETFINENNILLEANKRKDMDANIGDIAEGILGAAITAKFCKRNGETNIDISDIGKIIVKLKDSNPLEFDIDDIIEGKTATIIQDNITFSVNLPAAAFNALFSKKVLEMTDVKDLYKSAINFVNNDQKIKNFSELCASNQKTDQIEIISDGVGGQTSTKADILLKINGKTTGSQISLKAMGNNRLGQYAGLSFDVQQNLWDKGLGINIGHLRKNYEDKMKEADELLEIPIKDRKDERCKQLLNIVGDAAYIIYSYAAKEIKEKLKNKNNEEKFMENFCKFILYNSTLGEDSNIQLVKFGKGGEVKSLKFGPDFKEKISALDLDCNLRDEGNKTEGFRPTVIISNSKKNEKLFQIRAQLANPSKTTNSGKIYSVYNRNFIESFDLFDDLVTEISIKKEIKAKIPKKSKDADIIKTMLSPETPIEIIQDIRKKKS